MSDDVFVGLAISEEGKELAEPDNPNDEYRADDRSSW